MYCTPPVKRKARKQHRCDSCGESITIGETYELWACYDDVCTTSKMHLECVAMHCQESGDGFWEYTPLSHERPSIGQYGRGQL